MKKTLLLGFFFCLSIGYNQAQIPDEIGKPLPKWETGMLDLHHINTGKGNAAFFVFPDGTTMLVDAGVVGEEGMKKNAPLKITAAYPNDSLTPGGWIADYIRQMMPGNQNLQLDYALITHFHGDHYGNVMESTPLAKNGKYKLTGITEVGDLIPIKTMIDRNAPQYDFPTDLKTYYAKDATFQNYLAFINYHVSQGNMKLEVLQAGSNRQIVLKNNPNKFPAFQVRNVKANGIIWTGTGEETFTYFTADTVLQNGKFNENPLSLGLKISYGNFDYFTGGDMTGMQGFGLPWWFDVETPVAKAVGQVEAATMNHHGNRDAMNENFVKTLAPQVAIQQVWCSDHPGQEVFHRLASTALYPGARDLFATGMHEETKVTYGPWFKNAYRSMQGHVVIRVLPGGNTYYVYTLDDTTTARTVTGKYGPYTAR